MIYRDMDQASLDAAYNNSAAVGPRQQILVADWKTRSESIARQIPVMQDLRYGEGPRQRFDFFPCGQTGAPTLLFIHGGYWQMGDKEQFSFIAAGPLSRGINVAAIEYSLAPAIRMDCIVAEIRLALAWIVRPLRRRPSDGNDDDRTGDQRRDHHQRPLRSRADSTLPSQPQARHGWSGSA